MDASMAAMIATVVATQPDVHPAVQATQSIPVDQGGTFLLIVAVVIIVFCLVKAWTR